MTCQRFSPAHPHFNPDLLVEQWAEHFPLGSRLGVVVMEEWETRGIEMLRKLVSMLESPPWKIRLSERFPWKNATTALTKRRNSAAQQTPRSSLAARAEEPFDAPSPQHRTNVKRSCCRLAQMLESAPPPWIACNATCAAARRGE